MKNYYKVMLGRGSAFAEEAKENDFIGADFEISVNLKFKLPDDWREFNKQFIPVYLKAQPDKTRIGAGLACGQLWTVSKGIQVGDTVLSPTAQGSGIYMVGEVTGEYDYKAGQNLPHRRNIRWFTEINRSDMTQELQNSSGGITTVINLDKYAKELDLLIENPGVQIKTSDDTIEDPSVFALEMHLEDFLVHN